MAILRRWAFWRRVQYLGVLCLSLVFVFGYVYMSHFYVAASCFDGQRNGDERGVDCGGSCVRICTADVLPPEVRWARSFRVVEGQYNAVAYIENRNQTAGSPEIGYTITLYDESGIITERRGTSVLPPDSVYPIFEPRIDTGGRMPRQTFITLDPPELWLPAETGRDHFSIRDRQLFSVGTSPRLEAAIYNNQLTDARDVEVVATIFDSSGNALNASRTFVDRLTARSEDRVVFTWPEPIAATLRSCEVPSDVMVVLDRSGSMAADGGDPPEPLESAKNAARTFLQQLGSEDQVGYLSYATEPSQPIEQVLTVDRNLAASSIASTRMGEDGIQYTNMGDALRVAFTELQSARHRPDARSVIIFLTDGDVTRPVNPETGQRDIEYAAAYARQAADLVKANDVIIYTIGFGDFFLTINDVLNRDVELIRDLASDPTKYYEAPTLADLVNVYREIAADICEDGPAVIDIVPKTGAVFSPLR